MGIGPTLIILYFACVSYVFESSVYLWRLPGLCESRNHACPPNSVEPNRDSACRKLSVQPKYGQNGSVWRVSLSWLSLLWRPFSAAYKAQPTNTWDFGEVLGMESPEHSFSKFHQGYEDSDDGPPPMFSFALCIVPLRDTTLFYSNAKR